MYQIATRFSPMTRYRVCQAFQPHDKSGNQLGSCWYARVEGDGRTACPVAYALHLERGMKMTTFTRHLVPVPRVRWALRRIGSNVTEAWVFAKAWDQSHAQLDIWVAWGVEKPSPRPLPDEVDEDARNAVSAAEEILRAARRSILPLAVVGAFAAGIVSVLT